MRLWRRPKHRAKYNYARAIWLDTYATARYWAYTARTNKLIRLVGVFSERCLAPRLAFPLYTKRFKKFGTKKG